MMLKLNLIKEIHQYLQQEFDEMNKLILESLATKEELVSIIGNHIAKSGGKRIRPILTLLSAKMFDDNNHNAIKLAAAVEFIHMATLLHDDVVDGSKMRRFLPSANFVWGNKASILVGDFLFSQSFKLIVETRSIDAMFILSNASRIIAEGEVTQLAKLQEHILINEEEYLQINRAKTAELFAAACEVGAIITNQSIAKTKILREFGMQLGCIFQIVDDLLDYFSDVKITGKNTGDDFNEGKVTLPIILLAHKLNAQDHKKLLSLLKEKERTKDDFDWVVNLLNKFNIKQDIKSYLNILKTSAHDTIMQIKVDNKCFEYLLSLLSFAVNRTS